MRGVRVRVRVSAATATAAACNVRGVRGRGRRADFLFVRKFFLILTSLLKNLNLRLRRPRGGAGLPPLAPPRRRRQHRHGKIPRAQSHPESHPETHPKPVLISEIIPLNSSHTGFGDLKLKEKQRFRAERRGHLTSLPDV